MKNLFGGAVIQGRIVTQLWTRRLVASLIFLMLSFSLGGINCTSEMQAQEPPKAMATGLGKEFTSETARVNGVTLHYVRGGKGHSVILIHGFPQDWFEYHTIMPRLAKQFTVIAVDLRGVGGSTATESGYDAANMAKDIYELAEMLKLEHVYIVGHDIGGHVAYAFARPIQKQRRER
jgi:alpha-beta hydrolase superfamily lysophospholipase